MNFLGKAKRLDDLDLPRIGARIGVGEDVIHALLTVETSGTGFDDVGRPKMLFEPHVFYRYLTGEKRTRAVNEGLAYKKWGTLKYPKNSYPRLEKALLIDETAALKAASWGLGQVLGMNFEAAGYDSPQAMVADFIDDEDRHLNAMINFIIENHIDDDLRRIEQKTKRGEKVTAADWVPVVRVYNGSEFAENKYHIRANNAYHQWLKIKDTPYAPTDIREIAARESETAHEVVDEHVEVETATTPATGAPTESAKGTPEERSQVTSIPAIPPFPVAVPSWAKKIVGWGATLNIGSLGASFAFLKDNPTALAAVLNIVKYGFIAMGVVIALVVIGVFVMKMWNAKLANELNTARLHNYGNENTKNIDFSGWKKTPDMSEVKF